MDEQDKSVVGKEKSMNYHMEKPSPSMRIANVLFSGVIYSSFLENSPHGTEEREISRTS